jgi:hypothetical protein
MRWDVQEGFRTGNHTPNGRQDAENERRVIVEGLAPCETEKETAHRVGAGNVGAPSTLGSFAPPIGKNRMMVINLDGLSPYQGAARDVRP